MKKINKFVYWTPRILSILMVGFIALFSFDVFGNGYSFWETVLALLMHNIPTLVLLAVVIIAWKHELVGAIGFVLLGLAYVAFILTNAFKGQFEWYMIAWFLQISGPLFFIAILYFVNWKRRKR